MQVAARSQLNEARERQEKQEEMNHMVSHALKDFEVERDKRNQKEQERIAYSLEAEMATFKNETVKQRKQIYQLEKERERYGVEAA